MEVAFLFDNDGVLVDSNALHWQSWQLLMKEEPTLQMNEKQFVHMFGKRNDRILQELAPHVPAETRKSWAEKKEEIFRREAKQSITLIPGIVPFLQGVLSAKIPHIIASSAPLANLELFLTATSLGNYFEHYISAESVAQGKPAPDVFVAAAHQLGFTPCQCVVFEDAPAGIKAGKAAPSFVVALETTHPAEELYEADLIYPSAHDLDLAEILAAFTKWSKERSSRTT
jgi:HAD superfamily hydrolase (TIGR01509 family)